MEILLLFESIVLILHDESTEIPFRKEFLEGA